MSKKKEITKKEPISILGETMRFEVVHFYRFSLKINIQREVKMVDSQKKMGGLVSISKKAVEIPENRTGPYGRWLDGTWTELLVRRQRYIAAFCCRLSVFYHSDYKSFKAFRETYN